MQLYDVQHSRKAGDAYKDHQLGLEDWTINEQGTAVLLPFADWTQHMQGTKYPTFPLVLPTVYVLIDVVKPSEPLALSFPGVDAYELQPDEMHAGVLNARTNLHNDLLRRFVTELDPVFKRTYAIATLLHPWFKDYSFIDEYSFIDQSDRVWAFRELETEWKFKWKPKPISAPGSSADPPTASPQGTATPAPASAPATVAVAVGDIKKRKVTLGKLLAGKVKVETPAKKDAPVKDELQAYLEAPIETNLELKLLEWWKEKEKIWPHLAKMAKQFLAQPASSAGVERVFSAAGKMHDDLRKSAKDNTLEHSLFAMANTD